jgi:hypothetical protein
VLRQAQHERRKIIGALENIAPAIAMLAAFACLIGGGVLVATRRNVGKGMLMLVMAAVLVGNVVIWTM